MALQPGKEEMTISDSSPIFRIGIDIGGTFTDIVVIRDDGSTATRKVSSTPADYARGIVDGLADLMDGTTLTGPAIREIIHGTTVATNAILEHKGARTGLITTAGFRDVLEIRRLAHARAVQSALPETTPARRTLSAPGSLRTNEFAGHSDPAA